jgi:hypothetical protein
VRHRAVTAYRERIPPPHGRPRGRVVERRSQNGPDISFRRLMSAFGSPCSGPNLNIHARSQSSPRTHPPRPGSPWPPNQARGHHVVERQGDGDATGACVARQLPAHVYRFRSADAASAGVLLSRPAWDDVVSAPGCRRSPPGVRPRSWRRSPPLKRADRDYRPTARSRSERSILGAFLDGDYWR